MSATAWLIGIGLAGVAAAGVGLGMQYNANKQAAANQAAMAKYNYAVNEQNIRQQQALAQWQATAQAKQQEANAAIARQTAAANAQNIEAQAQSTLNQGIEAQRRTREDQLRFSAIQRARVAKSGVASAGTPVEVLAESARDMQLALNDAWYETNTRRDAMLWDASMERYGGEVGAANYSGNASLLRAEASLAPIKARMDLRRAKYEMASGLNTASGMNSAATAGLVSGAGTLLSQGYQVGYQSGLGRTSVPSATSMGYSAGSSPWNMY
jgi:hypothetical protein